MDFPAGRSLHKEKIKGFVHQTDEENDAATESTFSVSFSLKLKY